MEEKLYNQEGKEVGKLELPEYVFNLPWNADLVHQVSVSMMANIRMPLAHAKTRGEVRGGGKKQWRQKGTGRARHGSIRSPLWRGGGITFGPRTEKVFERDIPKKMRRKALFMVLSQKAKDKQLVVLDKFSAEKPKTKEIAKTFNKLPMKGGTVLISLPKYDKNIYL